MIFFLDQHSSVDFKSVSSFALGPKLDEKGVEGFREAFEDLGRLVLQMFVLEETTDYVAGSYSRLDASLLLPANHLVCRC